jgi:hypothetical protein
MPGVVYYDVVYHVQEGMEAKHADVITSVVKGEDKDGPDMLLYFFTEDSKEKNKWTLREVHTNESSMMQHFERVKDIVGPWIECMVDGKFDCTMLGDFGDAAKEACKSLS